MEKWGKSSSGWHLTTSKDSQTFLTISTLRTLHFVAFVVIATALLYNTCDYTNRKQISSVELIIQDMFSNRSTDNLLDNLEKELNEVIELDNPVVRINSSALTQVEIEHEKPKNLKIPKSRPPVPTKRIFAESSEASQSNNISSIQPPTAANTRRVPLRDKRVKNNENEIIQLSSVSSASASEDQKLSSGKTILLKNSEKNSHKTATKVAETIFIESPAEQPIEINPKVEIVTERENFPRNLVASTSSAHSSSEASISTSSTSAKLKRRKKKKSQRSKSKSHQDEIDDSEKPLKKSEKIDRHEIAAVLHTCGPLKFDMNFKSGLRIRVSLFNEDTGKLIDESKLSRAGKFNKDFL